MKKLLVIFVLCTVRMNAYADQCGSLDEKLIRKVKKLVKKRKTVYSFCQPCGQESPEKIVVKSVDFNEEGFLGTLKINGKTAEFGHDLAYLYVKAKNGNNLYENLALRVNCGEVSGSEITMVSKYIKKVLIDNQEVFLSSSIIE